MAEKRQYVLFGTNVDEGKCKDDEQDIKKRWNSVEGGGKCSDRMKYFIGSWMKALGCNYELAKAWAFSRCGSNSTLNPTSGGWNKDMGSSKPGVGVGVWAWDTQSDQSGVVGEIVKGGYLPSEIGSKIPLGNDSEILAHFKAGNVPFEAQVWAGLKYNIKKHIREDEIQKAIDECGNDIGKLSMCFRGVCSYNNAKRFTVQDGYMKVPFWAQCFNECLESEGGQSQIPQVNEGELMSNMSFSSAPSPGGGYAQSGYVSQEAPYTPVTWKPPIQGGVIKMFDLSKEKKGKIGMILGTHLRQKNFYGKKPNIVSNNITVNKSERNIDKPDEQ